MQIIPFPDNYMAPAKLLRWQNLHWTEKQSHIFLNWCIKIYVNITKFLLRGSIDNKSALVQVMAWHRRGGKPSPKAMLTKIYDVIWTSYQIRKIAGCACTGKAGSVFSRSPLQRKLLVSDPGMHHGTCVTHVPWCMSGSLTLGDGENVPGIPGACTPAILRIW